ncbi:MULTISPECIES: SCP2 sterol-binding domain-containing protein [Luteimonas]|uniref:Ubiquinone biosynthesis accessory factor UbiJ n=1 Tax=Luteimonas chenhongjianii TaxID=2006110 RepID=A0A290XHK2_9GAMM|nr:MULTISPECIES: SCP2 sterol-binding domain-containing protein [Luteimonas]ATD68642.1 SCP2 domain-containing protein [Luteimonas chenhongjianii]RPD85513.1 SCP2 domain-containing protein [Luteimonas sp. 100069]
MAGLPSPFAMLKPIAGRALETALNRALALDADTRAALIGLHGQRIALTLASPPLALELRVEGERLCVGPVDAALEPDLAVRTTLAGMLSQLPFLRRDDAPPIGKVRVSGDAELARRLQKLAGSFDPDWQQPFVAVFGDVIGVQVANAFAAALRQAKDLGGTLTESAVEYVTEESRDVLGRDELAAFHDDVDVLRDDVERLSARVSRLQHGPAA